MPERPRRLEAQLATATAKVADGAAFELGTLGATTDGPTPFDDERKRGGGYGDRISERAASSISLPPHALPTAG